MSKRALGLLSAFLLTAAVIYASDPWKEKDPQTWDAKDVQKILQDSPWSHKIQFGTTGTDAIQGTTSTGANTSLGGPDKGLGSGAGATGIAGTTVDAPNVSNGPPTGFTISWISSRTIREAQARRRELGGVSREIARKDLAITPDACEVMVAGSDMSALSRQSEDQLKTITYLMLRNSKTKVRPSRIRIQKDQIGAPAAVVFVFDRRTATGALVFPENEKGAEFVTALGKTQLKTSFEFSRMRDKQGLDL